MSKIQPYKIGKISALCLAITLCWTGLYVWDIFERSPATAFKQDDIDSRKRRLKGVIDCALMKVAGATTAKKAAATLEAIGDHLIHGFEYYGASSDIEKIHFLAQVMHESNYWTRTVGSAGWATWREEVVFDFEASKWNRPNYLNAIHSDKEYYESSRNRL